MATTKVTKSEFVTAYNTHLPSKWIKFAYKYFSKETEKKDMSLRNHITFFLFGMFLLGFFATVLELSYALIGFITIWYAVVLSVLVLYLLSAVLLNNRRLKIVMKDLGITKAEYNKLADKYL